MLYSRRRRNSNEIRRRNSKDKFYLQLDEVARNCPHVDRIILLGNFNSRVGSSQNLWPSVLDRHGVGSCNENGLRLLSFCAEHGLVITNTLFQLRDKYKTTWMHPRSKKWHLIDYVLVKQQHRKDVVITRSIRGADGWTDHRIYASFKTETTRSPTSSTWDTHQI